MSSPSTPACARCGEPITPGARFCMKCGSDISGEQGAVPTAMLPAQEPDANEVVLELLKKATIGEYEILRELGRGGMATVYLAHDIALDRKVALKVMSPALLLMGEGMTERFKREARTAASLSHPNIIPIYTVKSAGKTLFFVMKFIPGRSLESLIKDMGPMPVPMVRDILQQVGGALGYAHRHGIVHRDVKPANIMIDEEGWTFVTDFGIAKVAENRGLTMTGIAVGTPSYMSPEQCAAKDITGKSDQYSLGVVAYEMLTGKQPFEGDSAMAIMFAHFHEAPRPLGERRPDLPVEVASAVMRMLEKAPEGRWPSIEDALAAMVAEPLGSDHPVRAELKRIVRARSNRAILDSITPAPTSPVPPAKRPTPSSQATTPIPRSGPTALVVQPAASEVIPGGEVFLTAVFEGENNNPATQPGSIIWASSNPEVATVSPVGLVTGKAPGWVSITATCAGLTGEAAVVVGHAPVASVTIEPADSTLMVGDVVSFRATLRDAAGNSVSDQVTWAAAPAGLVRTAPGGEVTALKAGTVEVTAESQGIRGRARLVVTPVPVASVTLTPPERSVTVGDTAAFTAVPTDAKGQPLADRPVTWASAAPGIVAVSQRGIVTGLAEGTADITAKSEGSEARARVRVTPAPVAVLAITPPDPLAAGASALLQVVLKDARGHVLTGREVKWSSSTPAIAAVTPQGELTAIAPGTARIAAESEGKSGTVAVTVLPAPVASVVIEGPATLPVNGTAALTVAAKDARGILLTGRTVAWNSTDPQVLSVNSRGAVTARRPGAASITATVDGMSAELTITVPAPSAAAVATEIVPPPAPVVARTARADAPAAPAPQPAEDVRIPDTAEHPAAARGGRGRLFAGLTVVAVLAVVGVVLMKRQAGNHVVPGPPPPVVAVPGPVASVTITGDETPLAIGRTRQLAAALKDAAGTDLNDRAVTWTSSDPAIAEVSGKGAVTAHRAGNVTITAASEGKQDEFGVVVEAATPDAPPPVATLTLTGGGKALEVNETAQLTAVPHDARGAALTDRMVVWTSADPKVAQVSASGTVTAIGPGSTTVTASSEGKSADLRLSVNRPKEPPKPAGPAPVASVALTPTDPTVTAGQSVQLSAAVLDAARTPLTGRSLTWKSSDETIARVSADGLVSGEGKGSATITATVEGKSASTRVTVNEATVPVAGVAVTPAARTLKVGETTTWEATARDAKGKELADRTISWSSSAPQVASVNGSGVITAVAAGTAEIRASVEGKAASGTITVTAPAPAPPPVATVTPPATTGAGTTILPRRAIEAGGAFSCGINATGAVCWGAGFEGLYSIAGTAGITGLTVGRVHACGLVSGKAVCWGENRVGQLGDGSITATTAASPVAADLSFTMLSAGFAHTCGLSGGKAYCWGKGKEGQLGDGGSSDRRKPVAVVGGKSFVAISAGGNHTCALTAAGQAYCWGDGFSGQLGYGAQDEQHEPIDVSGNLKFAKIAAGGQHTCGITTAGKTYCWGANDNGQLGDGSKTDRTTPQAVAGAATFEELSLGANHSCGRTAAGEVWCWGENRSGQLGDGTRVSRERPVPVVGTFSSVSAGEGLTCGLAREGPACWGRNDKGQLGDGSTTAQMAPTPLKP